MRIVTQVITVIGICFVLASTGISIYMLSSTEIPDQTITPTVEFSMNTDSRTLTVADINFNTNWDYITVDGDAVIPSGNVDVGDTITNCYGNIGLSLSGTSLGNWNFGWEAYPYEDVLFVGDWVDDADGEYNFLDNGTILCESPRDQDVPAICHFSNGNYELEVSIDLVDIVQIQNESIMKKTWNYGFADRNNQLYLWNETTRFRLLRQVYPVQKLEDITNYSGQKVNITGNLTSYDDGTIGNLTVKETGLEIIVLFNNYSEGNASMFDNQTVQIIGFLFQPNEEVAWDKPYIDYIESVKIIQE
jgi:hypothetical protein